MHILDNVNKEVTDDELIELLADKTTRRIINIIQTRPMLISEITKKCDMSINSVYRRIHKLEKYHLLHVSGIIDKAGKRKNFYQSKINSYFLKFENGKSFLEIKFSESSKRF